MEFLSNFFTKISALGLGADVWLFFCLLAASFLYTSILGRKRVLLFLTSIYVTLGVLAYTPFIGLISETSKSVNQVIFFTISFFVLFFLLVRGILGKTFVQGGFVSGRWSAFVLAFFQLGLLVSVILSFLPASIVNIFSLAVQKIFLSSWGRFVWFVTPIFLMAAFAHPHDED
ncbi:MAG TPA: hypothetical protein PKY08_00215 [Candidatus Magasanikbacteria bacterium]|nr:hypothetical protein [Candidatus Magasanikbacteria bacterium]